MLLLAVTLTLLAGQGSAANSETKTLYDVTVTLPETWIFKDAPYYLAFGRAAEPNIHGTVSLVNTISGTITARDLAESGRNNDLQINYPGSECGPVINTLVHGKESFSYTLTRKDGITGITIYTEKRYIAVGDITSRECIILYFSAPSDRFGESGVQADFNFIKDNISF